MNDIELTVLLMSLCDDDARIEDYVRDNAPDPDPYAGGEWVATVCGRPRPRFNLTKETV